MESIEKITDASLQKMKPGYLWSWGDWAEKIAKIEMPVKETYEYQKFIAQRNQLKQQVNKELARRKLPDRLECLGNGEGIYLLNEKTVSEKYAEKGMRKVVNVLKIRAREFEALIKSPKLPDQDRTMLRRLTGTFEQERNGLIGSVVRMRSLSAPAKKRLLKNLGASIG